MSIELTSLFLLLGLLGLMACGVPLGFSAGALAMGAAFVHLGPEAVPLAHSTIYSLSTEYLLVSVPMFILMASLLEKSGIARDLYSSLQRLAGALTGGVASVTLILSVLLAAMSGIIGGEIVLLGLVALPQMLRLNYDRRLAIGIICAGGSLATMIPPSIVLIIYGLVAEVSVQRSGGDRAGIIAGFLLLRVRLRPLQDQPSLAPALTADQRATMSVGRALVLLIPALLLISMVMGFIYGGVTSVTEAACVGVAGTLISVVARGEFRPRALRREPHTDTSLLRRHTLGHVRRQHSRQRLQFDRRAQFLPRSDPVLPHPAPGRHRGDDDHIHGTRHIHGLDRHPVPDHAGVSADHHRPWL